MVEKEMIIKYKHSDVIAMKQMTKAQSIMSLNIEKIQRVVLKVGRWSPKALMKSNLRLLQPN